MGSVQQCFSWELVVAASIIWHRLQRGVTFVLQDGWLCMAWTLLTLSHWWASRRGYKRHTFPQATGAKMRRKSTGLLQCDSTFQFIYLIKLCVRYWNIYSEKTLLQKKKKKILSSGYWVCSGYSWDHAVYWDRWKMSHLPSSKVVIFFPHRSPLFRLRFDVHASFKIDTVRCQGGSHNFHF